MKLTNKFEDLYNYTIKDKENHLPDVLRQVDKMKTGMNTILVQKSDYNKMKYEKLETESVQKVITTIFRFVSILNDLIYQSEQRFSTIKHHLSNYQSFIYELEKLLDISEPSNKYIKKRI